MTIKYYSRVIERREVGSLQRVWDDTGGITIMTYDADIFKQQMREYCLAGKLSYGKYRNIVIAVNVFMSYFLKEKSMSGDIRRERIAVRLKKGDKLIEEVVEVDTFTLTEQDLFKFFNNLYLKVSIHTFRVYMKYIQFFLERILENNGKYLDDYFKPRLFDPGRYILSSHDYYETRSQGYELLDRQKHVTLENIKDTFEYLAMIREQLEQEKIEISQMSFDKLRMATLLLTFTGARGSELANLRVLDINFRGGYMILYRNKLKRADRATVFPLHPYLKKQLRKYIRNYQLDQDDYILINWRYLDKHIALYYTPQNTLKIKDRYVILNKRRYPLDKPVITVRKFRKFWDNYAEGKMDSKYKNYLLGRFVGVDMTNYVSLIHNKRVFKKLAGEYMKVFGNLDKKLERHLKKVFSS